MPTDLLAGPSAGGQPTDLLAGLDSAAPAAPQESVMGRIGHGAEALGLGTLQGASEAGRGVGDLLDRVLNTLAGTHLDAPEGSFFVGQAAPLEKLPEATVGKFIGQAAPALATGGLTTEAAIPGMLTTAGVAAATQPGGALKRTEAGVLGALGGGLGHLGKALKYLPASLSDTALAKTLKASYGQQTNIAKALYKRAFAGTKDIKPVISQDTQSTLDALVSPKSGNLEIKRAISRYQKNPILENLHKLKSDFGTISSKMEPAHLKGSLTSVKDDQYIRLGDAVKSISQDLDDNMSQLNPDKYGEYRNAQDHWRENVVPFKQLASVRKLIGPQSDIAPGLRKAILQKSLEDAGHAAKLRRITGLKESHLEKGPLIKGAVKRMWPYLLGGTALGYAGGETLRKFGE